MKNLVLTAIYCLLILSCGKKNAMCTNASPESEEADISKYCIDYGIDAQKDPSGIYFEIISPGTAPTPDLNDTVYVLYKGMLLDGTVIDERSTTPDSSVLGDLIDGWKIGLQRIAKGGQIKMVVPSSLCYGCNGIPGLIPPNTILYFDVKLVNVKPKQ